MASTEVAYELRDRAAYMVASQESEGADGWPYARILTDKILKSIREALIHKIDLAPRELAVKVVKESAQNPEDLPTMSAVDMGVMAEVAKASDALAKQIIATSTPKDVLKEIIGDTESFGGFKDEYDFAGRIAGSGKIKDQKLKAAAKGVMAALKKAVIAEQHSSSHPDAHGLHIELPSWGGEPSSDYKKLEFAKDTRWDEALEKISREGATMKDDWNIT
jgi:hypothetical protein